ncbi:MAG TPA: phosphatase PAP2 family protein [Chloroflexota bacterium]|nr:phosphatase PAP2 family protein [Chloroflexota bacterium]
MAVPRRVHPEAATPPPPSTRRHLARIVTEVFAPAPTVVVLLLLVAWRSAPTPGEALKWGALAALFACLVPLGYVLRAVRRRQLTDRHVRVRAQRPLPLLVGIASVLVGLALLAVWGAPRELVALVAAMAVGLVTALLVTLFWKVSVHAAVIAGAVVILVLVFGPRLLLLAPLVALVGWARVESGDHSPAQVIVGALLGGAVAATMFPLLR